MRSRPATAITRASSTLASAIPDHPISIFEHGMAPTITIARATSGSFFNMLLEIKNAVIEAIKYTKINVAIISLKFLPAFLFFQFPFL